MIVNRLIKRQLLSSADLVPFVIVIFTVNFCGIAAAQVDPPAEKNKVKKEIAVTEQSTAPSKDLSVDLPENDKTIQKKKKTKSKKPASRKSAAVSESESTEDISKRDNSMTWRATKKQNYSLLLSPFSHFGAQAQVALSPSLQLGFMALTVSDRWDDKYDWGVVTLRGRASSFSFQARYFFGNSFNVLTGLGYRAVKYKIDAENMLLMRFIEGDLGARGATLPLFIGNQWTWSGGFTLGVDWIGVLLPLSGQAEVTLNGDVPQETLDALTEDLMKVGDKLSKRVWGILFLTSIGWSF